MVHVQQQHEFNIFVHEYLVTNFKVGDAMRVLERCRILRGSLNLGTHAIY